MSAQGPIESPQLTGVFHGSTRFQNSYQRDPVTIAGNTIMRISALPTRS
jgi:hypothetical protein